MPLAALLAMPTSVGCDHTMVLWEDMSYVRQYLTEGRLMTTSLVISVLLNSPGLWFFAAMLYVCEGGGGEGGKYCLISGGNMMHI